MKECFYTHPKTDEICCYWCFAYIHATKFWDLGDALGATCEDDLHDFQKSGILIKQISREEFEIRRVLEL